MDSNNLKNIYGLKKGENLFVSKNEKDCISLSILII